MTRPIDYRALFAATPTPCLVLGTDLVIMDVNPAYLVITGCRREDVLGRHIFDVFPDNPADPAADGVRNLRASMDRVLRSGEPDIVTVQKFDIPTAGRPGMFDERWWSPINAPAFGPDGEVAWILHRAEIVRSHPGHPPAGSPLSEREAMEVELSARARELQRLNEALRRAHARERQVATTLQQAMLHSPDLDRHRDVAVRYLPATGSLPVCGDWYDVVDLPREQIGVAVGDVVGHGLEAASVMGMLRSALSAAVRALREPARALDVLGHYTRSVEGALATTAFQAVVDTHEKIINYSSAGHLPPFLAHPDGTFRALDQATDPPLGALPEHTPSPHAALPYAPGDTLVLYTDGLVERRGEDIDAGLRRLTDTLARSVHLSPERLADELLTSLGVGTGSNDDIALIVIRL